MNKYDDLLVQLKEREVYSAGAIIRFAQEIGYATTHLALLRIRINLNNKATRYQFPTLGDGWVHIKGQGPTPGWFGWRWKTLISDKPDRQDQATNEPTDTN